MAELSRRKLLSSGAAATLLATTPALSRGPFRLGLTPVFLDNDATVIEYLRTSLEALLKRSVYFEQRRTYEEVTGLLLEGSVDAAWLCGYPYLQHKEALSLVAVPVWNAQPLYRSYLIASASDPAEGLVDLRGDTHAFSDPNSNSGFLVTASDLARMGENFEQFFGRTIFTYGHRNVVRAVADGLVRSGSVDGYVWEALKQAEPALAGRTKVIARSEWLGFPPFCALAERINSPELASFQTALLGLAQTADGRAALDLLQLDGMTTATPALYDGIAQRMQDMAALR